ncbi:hypothetical protein B0H10DRAFT_1951635 [Mycena sp. CBHHK59/15]|nr:hypothetical protein B0H10DRAFT_1951635 [Mycena sp. CBHHK59/15]
MSKHKVTSHKAPKSLADFSPMISKEEKAAMHCKASAAYYARFISRLALGSFFWTFLKQSHASHPEVREKRRVQHPKKRAARKLKRRQWDPSKMNAACRVENSITEEAGLPTRTSNEDVNDAEQSFHQEQLTVGVDGRLSKVDIVLGSADSPTSDEHLVSQALAAMADPQNIDVQNAGVSSGDSIMVQTKFLSSENGTDSVNPTSEPELPLCATQDEGTHLLERLVHLEGVNTGPMHNVSGGGDVGAEKPTDMEPIPNKSSSAWEYLEQLR